MHGNLKNLVVTIPSTAVLFCSYLGQANFPDQPNYLIRGEGYKMGPMSTQMPWELDPNPYYELLTDRSRISYQIEVIHSFVSKVLEESQDLDPKFAKVVDKYFWDLV